MRAVLSTSKCVARPDIGMLIELALREASVVSFATVRLDAARPEQTKSECTVAFVASIVSLGVLLVRMMNSSWLGLDTSVAWGCVAPTYWKSICETELELTEFKTRDAKPTVGTSPQYTPAVG